MKTICIAGHCGSGKTTAIEIMANHLPNSAVIRGDLFIREAIKNSEKAFEKIYGIPFSSENAYEDFEKVNNDTSDETLRKYLEFFNAFYPYIETEIEKAFVENREKGKDYILIEYVALPIFRIWEQADFRLMLTANSEVRCIKVSERSIAKRGTYNESSFQLLREKGLSRFVDNAKSIDFTIENKYDENYEKDLIDLCQKIILL